nr:hypothetical protein [Streptomyces sp. NBRC 109706]
MVGELAVDVDAGASFVMECAVCGGFGPRGEDAEDGAEWAVSHLGLHPGHRVYRERVTRVYRFEAGEAA